MNCGDIPPMRNAECVEANWQSISDLKLAGTNVNIDFLKPIDLSKMDVGEVNNSRNTEQSGKVEFTRVSVLHTFIVNEFGNREELTITFELKSDRLPKLTP